MRISKYGAIAAISVLALSACKQTGTTGSNNVTAESNSSENVTTNGSATAAASSIDGTWKTDISTIQVDAKPDQLLLKGGKFSCATCTPPLTIAADGAFHAVTGRPYADEISVKVDDDHNVTRTGRKAAKTTSVVKYSVSADGKTLTVTYDDNSGSKPVHGSYTETRAGAGPAGAHAVSGSWKRDKYNSVSDEGLTVTFKADPDMLHMSAPTGQSYDAKLDGTETPVKGDIGGTVVSVKKNGDAYVETDKIDSKVISVVTMTVGADGKLHSVEENKRNGVTMKYVMNKQ
jgi:hypothetical protein